MKIRLALFGIITVFFFNSCKTELDILAPYKEIPVIYGVISHADPIHYIRVQKAFLGAGDAYSFSTIPDSNYFKNLSVKLIPFKLKENGDTLFKEPKEIILSDTIIQGKGGGIFFQPGQKLYKTTAKLDSTFSLNLVVVNNDNGKKFSAFTPLIEHINITTPNPNPQNVVVFASQPGNYSTFTPQWNIGSNGYYSELYLVLHYTAKYLSNGIVNSHTDSIVWKQTPVNRDQFNSNVVSVQIAGEEFYKFVQQTLSTPGDTLERVFDGIEFIADVSGREFYNYLTLNQPSTTIVQDKPVYTNISEGYGIFTTRLRTRRVNKQLTSASKNELMNGQYTAQLKFK